MIQPIDRARRLLELAERDIISFRALSGHPEVDISATGFFAQQVVEKCLKAVAEYHGTYSAERTTWTNSSIYCCNTT